MLPDYHVNKFRETCRVVRDVVYARGCLQMRRREKRNKFSKTCQTMLTLMVELASEGRKIAVGSSIDERPQRAQKVRVRGEHVYVTSECEIPHINLVIQWLRVSQFRQCEDIL